VRVRKGKLESTGTAVCDDCMERVSFCEFNGIVLDENESEFSYLKLGYLKKPIYYHWGTFTYASGRPVAESKLKKLAEKDDLVRLLLDGDYEIDNDFLNQEFVYFDFCYYIDEEAREKLIDHIENNSLRKDLYWLERLYNDMDLENRLELSKKIKETNKSGNSHLVFDWNGNYRLAIDIIDTNNGLSFLCNVKIFLRDDTFLYEIKEVWLG